MKKLGWYAVSAVVALFVLGGILLLATNLYVQSKAVQHRIKEALGARLRMPVTLKKTTFSPWDGLRIDGIVARPPREPGAEDAAVGAATFLTANSFRVQFSWGPLLRRRFHVDDVLLDQPRLSWAQDKTNRWHLPGKGGVRANAAASSDPPAPLPAPPAGPGLPGAAVGPTTAGLPDRPDAPPRPALSPSTASGTALSVEKLRLRHGYLDFLNHRRGLLGHFENVSVDAHLTNLNQAKGHALVSLALLPRAGLRLTQLQTDFFYDQGVGLTLRNAVAGLAGGKLTADCQVQTGADGSPFQAHCSLENVGLGRFIEEAGAKLGLVEGRLRGKLDLQGFSDDAERCEASGRVELVDTQLRNFPLFQVVGDTLHIEDLRRLRFKTAQLDYQLSGNTLHVQPLVLVSSNLRITAEGRYLLADDQLDLHARLVIDPSVSRQLPRAVEQQFSPCGDEAPGSRYIDFNVAGPLNKPRSDLYQRLLPKTIDSLLDGLLRHRSKRSKPVEPELERATPPQSP